MAERRRADASPPLRPTERRLSTPLVLTLSSAMLAVALVLVAGLESSDPVAPAPEPSNAPSALRVDTSTPERAAESYYDAWRRRRWEEALAVSVGEARAAVVAKRARDASLSAEEREIGERSWQALAHAPLTLALDEAEMLEGDRTRLSGIAEYLLVNQPYRRRVSFLVVPAGPRAFRVAEMELGEVLTELPAILRGEAGGEL